MCPIAGSLDRVRTVRLSWLYQGKEGRGGGLARVWALIQYRTTGCQNLLAASAHKFCQKCASKVHNYNFHDKQFTIIKFQIKVCNPNFRNKTCIVLFLPDKQVFLMFALLWEPFLLCEVHVLPIQVPHCVFTSLWGTQAMPMCLTLRPFTNTLLPYTCLTVRHTCLAVRHTCLAVRHTCLAVRHMWLILRHMSLNTHTSDKALRYLHLNESL